VADLRGRGLLLSASFPALGERGDRYRPYDADAIADAVATLVDATFAAHGRLIFGGHPTITPLVMNMAAARNVRDAVDVFQSGWYADRITQPTLELERRGFGRILPTEKLDTEPNSLRLMRARMIGQSNDLAAAVFVGGMEGIEEEYREVGLRQPAIPRLTITAPGGAAARLASVGPMTAELPDQLLLRLRSPRYPLVAAELLAYLAKN
jgi:hypothetical protein